MTEKAFNFWCHSAVICYTINIKAYDNLTNSCVKTWWLPIYSLCRWFNSKSTLNVKMWKSEKYQRYQEKPEYARSASTCVHVSVYNELCELYCCCYCCCVFLKYCWYTYIFGNTKMILVLMAAFVQATISTIWLFSYKCLSTADVMRLVVFA